VIEHVTVVCAAGDVERKNAVVVAEVLREQS